MIESDGWETAWPDLQASARGLRLLRPWPAVPPLRDRGCPCPDCASPETHQRAHELAAILDGSLPRRQRWLGLVLPRVSLPVFAVEFEGPPRWS